MDAADRVARYELAHPADLGAGGAAAGRPRADLPRGSEVRRHADRLDRGVDERRLRRLDAQALGEEPEREARVDLEALEEDLAAPGRAEAVAAQLALARPDAQREDAARSALGALARLRLAAWIRRWLRPPRTLRPTRAGWIFGAITFSVGFAALNTGNNLLYLVLSLMLAFLVLSGVLSESALRGIQVRRRIPAELFDREVARVGLEISNRQRRIPAFAVVVEDRVCERGGTERAAGRVFALRVGPGERELRSYRFRPAGRGEVRFEAFQVYTRFPFGLFSKALRIDSAGAALVYPAVDPVGTPPQLGSRSEQGERPAGRGAAGSEVAGLRDFRPGDPVRRIHWPTSLRREALVVREIRSHQQDEVEVRLRTAGQAPGDLFERAVSWAASEVVAFLAAGSRVGLRTDRDHLPGRDGAPQRARLLAFLARVEPEAAPAGGAGAGG